MQIGSLLLNLCDICDNCDISPQGVTEAYTNALPTLTFAGPTCVAPVIATAADVIRDVTVTQGNQIYHVLLILTVSLCLP